MRSSAGSRCCAPAASMRRLRPGALETIERNARAQKRLIEDLLDVSRIVTGKLGLELADVEPRRVVQAAIATMQPRGRGQGSQDRAALRRVTAWSGGIPRACSRSCCNLLSNAIKFTAPGGRVDVELATSGDQVADHRRGHRPGHQARIPAARVRALPPGRRLDQPAARRPRAGARDRPPPRGAALRDDRSPKRRRRLRGALRRIFANRLKVACGALSGQPSKRFRPINCLRVSTPWRRSCGGPPGPDEPARHPRAHSAARS